MQQPTTLPSARTVSPILYTGLALLFALLWASAFMGVKFGLMSSPPLFLSGLRFLLAATTLLLLARWRGLPFPDSRREWLRLGVLGLLNNALYLGLSATAMRHLSGGMAAVLASTNPLMLALVAPLFLKERPGLQKSAGLLVAFGGVVAVMQARTGGLDAPLSMALVLLANALMVTGTILFKRWAPRQDLLVVNGVQLLFAGVALLAPSLLFEPLQSVRWDLHFFGALVFLAFGISGGAMLIWFFLLRNGDAGRASVFLFLNPVLGLFLGALMLGEPLRPLDFACTAVIALGIWLVQRAT
ncbi:MAG TPA: EamA family transporter [Symbiobacteriaceae bacterium]|jgi:drug/metabolite transporter (DMT)-like permease